MESLKISQKELVKNFTSDVIQIQKAKDDFHQEISDFKLVKSRLEKKLSESFTEEIKEFLLPKLDRLDKAITEFEATGTKSSVLSNNLSKLSEEINKFVAISEHIKQGDYDLRKFAAQLQTADKEKLELMRKIDSLERLASTLRRKSPLQSPRY
jgi:hypothetical protein